VEGAVGIAAKQGLRLWVMRGTAQDRRGYLDGPPSLAVVANAVAERTVIQALVRRAM
jgi:hypothetical protein